ncbi:MAG: hypothetical protein M3P91_00035 [Actinomycetota bacterium]|nr:hypothetical protein [Actinomycetota bacterium]
MKAVARGRVRPLWLLVASREVVVRCRSRMLWISTVTLMLLIVGGVAALHVLSDVRTSYTVGVVSGDAVEVVGLADGNPDTTVHAARFPELAEAQRAAAAGHLDAVLVQRRPPGSWTVISSGRSNGQLNGVLTAAVQAYVTERNARALACRCRP